MLNLAALAIAATMHQTPSLISSSNACSWFGVVVVCGILVGINSFVYSAEDDLSIYQTSRGQPNELSYVQFVSNNLEDLEASWCSDQPDVTYSLTYTTEINVFWNLRYQMVTNPVVRDYSSDDTHRTCWKSVWRYENSLYYLRIYGSNSALSNRIVYSTSAKANPISALEYLRPAAVGSLNHSTPTQSSANISWSIPDGVAYKIEEVLLMYRINYTSKWDSRSVETNRSTTVLLGSLHADTLYNISVACKPVVGGYWSDSAFTQFKTREAAPSVPPEIQPDFFYFEPRSDEQDRDCYTILFWKPVPEQYSNGILNYEVIVVGSQNISVAEINRTSTFARLKLSRSVKHTVYLRAFTSAGYSPVTSIVIPEFKVIDPQTSEKVKSSPFYAESSGNRGVVTFVWNSSVSSPTAVFYCRTNKRQHETVNEHYPCDTQDINVQMISAGQKIDRITVEDASLDSKKVLWYTLSGGANPDPYRGSSGLLGPWNSCVFDSSLEALPSKPIISLNVRTDISASNTTTVLGIARQSCEEQPLVRIGRYILETSNTDSGYHFQKNLSADTFTCEVTECSKYHNVNFTVKLTAVSLHGKLGPYAVTSCYTRGREAEEQLTVVYAVIALVCVIAVIVCIIIGIMRCKCIRDCVKGHCIICMDLKIVPPRHASRMPSTDYTQVIVESDHQLPRSSPTQQRSETVPLQRTASSEDVYDRLVNETMGSYCLVETTDVTVDSSRRCFDTVLPPVELPCMSENNDSSGDNSNSSATTMFNDENESDAYPSGSEHSYVKAKIIENERIPCGEPSRPSINDVEDDANFSPLNVEVESDAYLSDVDYMDAFLTETQQPYAQAAIADNVNRPRGEPSRPVCPLII